MPDFAEGQLSLLDKAKYLISNPNYFFDRIKDEKGILNSLIFYLICSTFYLASVSIFFLALFGIGGMSLGGLGSYGFLAWLPIVLLFAFFVLGIGFTFLYSLLVYAAVKIFGGEGTYAESYKAYTYSVAPAMLLAIIPYVGILGIIYAYFLMVIGVSRMHKLPILQSIIACLWPALLFLIFIFSLIFFFLINYRMLRF